MNLPGEFYLGASTAVGTIAAALSAVTIARINATKTDVGEAKQEAAKANTAAVEARDLSKPTGNGFAPDVRAALSHLAEAIARVERRQEADEQRQAAEAVVSRKLSEMLAEHFRDHAQIERPVPRQRATRWWR